MAGGVDRTDPVDTADGSRSDASAPRHDDPTLGLGSWDRYELLRELGRGAMGVVHEARDRRLGRVVALKFIRGGDPRSSMRLLQEARAQARIDHPHVCKIFEVGEVQGRAYIAMELVDGERVGDRAARTSLHDKVAIVRDAALGLHEAHTLGVLHRDVKPANILVEVRDDGRLRAVVMDFGLARHESEEQGLTETGALLGTPGYMSPEQARGEHRLLDRRSDVYSLGATLYELLGGAPPFAGTNTVQLLLQLLNDDPRPLRALSPSVPEDLETIAAKCLAKEPERRYDSARALAEDLDRYIRGEPILGRRPSLPARLWRRTRRHRAILATAALSLVALAVVGGLAIRARVQARNATQLGLEVTEVEWFLRTAYLLPVHDVSPEEGMVRERMARIAERAGGGALAEYAIGRGHLALREDELARASLDRALAAGLDTPELHDARGKVLGRLYERALATARRGGGQRIAALDEEYLAPALASFEKARGLRLESRTYIDGLLAYYRGDYPTAIALAATARAQAPWLYEATQLEADAHLARATALRGSDRAAAVADEAEAARLYDAALDVGRSDASLYLQRAEVWRQQAGMALAWEGATPPADPPERVEGWCLRAAVIEPGRVAPFDRLARVRIELAKQVAGRGADPRALYASAVEAAGRAAAIDERDLEAHLAWASARANQATYELDRGLDAGPAIEEALAQIRRAVAIEPRNLAAVNGLGHGYKTLAVHQETIGVDPIPAYRSALEQLGVVLRLGPSGASGLNALDAYGGWARALVLRRQDPGPFAPLIEVALIACRRGSQAAAYCSDRASAYYETVAGYELDAGHDGRAALDRAADLVGRAPGARRSPAVLALLRVRAAVAAGADLAAPRAELARSLAACFAADSGDPECTRVDAEAALRLAASPAELGHGREVAALAVARDGRSSDAAILLAGAELRLGHAREGLAACARGLAVNPRHPRLLELRDALLRQLSSR